MPLITKVSYCDGSYITCPFEKGKEIQLEK